MGLTVESVALEIAQALEPLTDRLAAGEVTELFAELGLPAPDTVLGVSEVSSAISAAATQAGNLGPKVTALSTAIEAEDVSGIVSGIRDLVPVVQAVITAIDAIADAVDAAAGAAAAAARSEIEAFAEELPSRLVGYLVATYLEREHPVISGAAGLLGILEVTSVAGTTHAPAHVQRLLRFDVVSALLEDPLASLDETYRWGTPDFKFDVLLRRMATFASRISGFAFLQPGAAGEPPVLRIGTVDIGRTPDAIPGLRATVRADLTERVDTVTEIRPGLGIETGLSARLDTGANIDVVPPGQLRADPPSAEVSGRARLGVVFSNPDSGPLSLLGLTGGSGILAARLRASAGADLTWDIAAGRADGAFLIEAAIEDGEVVIDLAGADGFLATILPDGGIRLPFDVLAGWSSATGVYFEGGAGLSIDIPVDFDLGPVKIQMMHLGFVVNADGLVLEASGGIAANLGPFAMSVDRMGTRALLDFPHGGGNLGPANLGFSFKPPTRIGLVIDAGVVKGGGFLAFEPEAGEYAGILELSFGAISIKAIGILTTKLPSGADGWALLLLVFGEFTPIQLGYGFTLNGVGGIIGLQHGVSIDAIQSGLRTGVLDSVLFPRDPVANANTLLAQLRVVFPIVPRALTVGPALKLGWSTPAIVTISLGIILQFDDVLGNGAGKPSFSRVVLVGQLKLQIPPVDGLALILLQVDIVGAYDANEKALSIDAVLRDSHVAGLPLTGSLVVRARFGDNATFLMAVGGFHPRFTDLPPGIPPQDRVGIQLAYDIVTLRIVGYVAITSNSFQTGAEASLVAAGGGFRIEAYLGFDALFLLEPRFHFEIEFRVGASVKYKSISLTSLKVRGVLTGPGRWEVNGHASISLLFFDVDIDFEVGWGSAPAPALPSVAVGPQIAQALSAPQSWHAELPGNDPLVSLRTVAVDGEILAHPLGSVVGVQKVAPLGLDLDRVGRSVPSDGRRFDIAEVRIGNDVRNPMVRSENFARVEYVDLSEEDKLSKPSFEKFPSGIAVSTEDFAVPASAVVFEPEWETFYLRQERPSERHLVLAASLVKHAQLGAVANAHVHVDRVLNSGITGLVSVLADSFGVAAASTPGQTVASGLLTFSEAEQMSSATTGTTFVVGLAEVVTHL
ncbi:DUF6603 domain-containing protein [Kocuria kalidii]|uniref:DUF6603 domain-containing protein n=1 Tax=Kocuria kalidii TaxID=3376283 RepID=UPI0037A6F513